ncbi:MAG TPA: EAL domain-containing protein [Steroidobacteraceae bacterium]|nr:EAL domain-containing protein [Steroidobacteraceae bacterium]
MHATWDLSLILLSFVLAFAASFTALNLASRITSASQAMQWRWLAVGGIAMGTGIWSMHFVGMLAMRIPLQLKYDLTTTADSLLIAMATSTFALKIASVREMGQRRLVPASAVMGGGIAAMHYTGVAAIRVVPAIQYDVPLVMLSLGIAMATSYAAMWLIYSFGRQSLRPWAPVRVGAAALMGLAVCGVHYTGMAATGINPKAYCFSGVALTGEWLAAGVAITCAAVLVPALLTVLFSARLEFHRTAYHRSLAQAQADRDFLQLHDQLTGLPNRERFLVVLNQAIADLDQRRGSLAVLVLDIDRFKAVNDAIGHQAGDGLLVQVTRRLAACLPASDLLARGGGDEFLILLRDIGDAQEVALFGARLLTAAREPYRIEGRDLYAHLSIGASLYPLHAVSGEELISHADEAVFNAKQGGRDQMQFYNRTTSVYTSERLQLEADLRHAIPNGQLELHYQPQIDIATGDITGMEALLRWRHPLRGTIPPLQFIALAEETGQIAQIGRWAIDEGCRQARAWELEGRPLRVAVNLSAMELRHAGLAQRVREALEEHQLRPDLLEVELTESAVMGNVEESERALQAIRALGVHIAVDDFGTGYSSLSYLKRLPITHLKIDRSFVSDLGDGNRGDSIARAIVSLGHALNLRVIAEGVETLEQLDNLRMLGCDEYQGYFCSRPLPVAQIGPFLAHWGRGRPLEPPATAATG